MGGEGAICIRILNEKYFNDSPRNQTGLLQHSALHYNAGSLQQLLFLAS